MTSKTFCIVDSCLKDLVGHHFEYDHAVANEAVRLGYDVQVLAHQNVKAEVTDHLECLPAFRDDIWQVDQRWARISPEWGAWHANKRFYYDLEAIVGHTRWSADSIVFGHMITARQLLAWAWWCQGLAVESCPQVVLLLRYQKSFYEDKISRKAFRLLERTAHHLPIRLATDSARLAADFASLTSMPIEVLAIPHTAQVSLSATTIADSNVENRRLRLVSLGNARDEKGYFEIIEAIKLLDQSPQRDRYEFVLQSNHPWPEELKSTIAGFDANKPTNVTLIHQPLNTQAYYDLLNSADIVLLPYWRSIYESRTSGVFVEALANGKPVIVSGDTWMSDCLQDFGAGLTCQERNPQHLVQAINTMAQDFREYYDNAQDGRAAWLKKQSPSALTEQLIAPTKRTPRRATVLYPWGNLIERDSGAAVRVGLLVDFLKQEFDEVRVFQTDTQLEKEVDNVRYECFKPNGDVSIQCRLSEMADRKVPPLLTPMVRWQRVAGQRFAQARISRKWVWGAIWIAMNAVQLLLTAGYCGARFVLRQLRQLKRGIRFARQRAFAYLPRVIRDYRSAHFMLKEHRRFAHHQRFHDSIKELVAWSDVVFLEYTFWAEIVAPYCREFGVKLVITDHDIVAEQCSKYAKVHSETLTKEIIGLKLADHAVSVSKSDQRFFASHGVVTTLIPNPIQFDTLSKEADLASTLSILNKLLDKDARRPICLFVGSPYQPNIDAVQLIRDVARRSRKTSNVLFVVAGGCAHPDRQDNFICLGRVDHAQLRALYHAAKVVLNPVRSGTGVAVKTIEAMAQGKVVLATSVGMRGYDVQSGVHCIISDRLDDYPEIIAGLLDNSALQSQISAEARKFAESFDYRQLYERYLQLLGDARTVDFPETDVEATTNHNMAAA